jgi:peptidoglycan/LPS O-acetylase OafA/YrhL
MDSRQAHANSYGADILRGVAILMVVVYHAFGPNWGYFVPWSDWLRDFSASPSRALLWCYPITFGWVGVPLFFVISGFCIHYSFLRATRFDARHFFWRRFWRIYPTYIAALLVFTLLLPGGIRSGQNTFQFVSHALFFHNASSETFFGISGSFWSIAVEVQLYLLFPLLLFVRARVGLPLSMAVLFVVGCCCRLVILWNGSLADHLITPSWTSPLMTWFDWSLGAFVAERFAAGQRAFGRPATWLVALIPLFVASTLVKPLTLFSFTLASAASAVVLDVALQVEWRRGAIVRSLALVGAISYSMYLWHQPLLAPLVSAMSGWTGSTVVAWLALGPIIFALSWLSYVVLERPGIIVGRAVWQILPGDAVPQSTAAPSEVRPGQTGPASEVEKMAA